jgi:hypothetical protein
MEKNQLPVIIVLLIISLLFGSCFHGIKGNRKVVKSERKVEAFESISVSAGIEVFLTQDSVLKVVVEADENLQEIIKTEVSKGELKIFPEKPIRFAAAKRVYVSFKTIHSLAVSSGAEVKSKMELKINSLDLSASSGAKIDLVMAVNKLIVEGNSGAAIDLSGSAETLDVDGSSGVQIKMSSLQSKTCNAGASSGAGLKIFASEKITAKASSGGNIKVSGNPTGRNVEKSSGGDVSFD